MTSAAEKLFTNRWRAVATATEKALELAQRGGKPIEPETLNALVVAPLIDALRADPAHAELVKAYEGQRTPVVTEYLEILDNADEMLEDLGVCRYFAMCINPAVGLVRNPIIGDVPTCQRCADHVGQTFVQHEVTAAA